MTINTASVTHKWNRMEHNRMRMAGVNWSTQRKTCPRNPAWSGLWMKPDSCGERHATNWAIVWPPSTSFNVILSWMHESQLLQHEYALEFNNTKKDFHVHNHRRRKFLLQCFVKHVWRWSSTYSIIMIILTKCIILYTFIKTHNRAA